MLGRSIPIRHLFGAPVSSLGLHRDTCEFGGGLFSCFLWVDLYCGGLYTHKTLFGTIHPPLYFRLIARQPAHLFIFGSTVCSPPVLLNLFHLVIQMLPHLFATLLLDMRTIGIYLIWHDGAIDCY